MPLYMNYPSWISPEVIPGLPIRWYGLMYLVAFGISYWLFTVQIKERKISTDQDTVINLYFYAILGLLIGARIFSAVIYDPSGKYLRAPWLIVWPFENGRFVGLQGMSYHGGLVGAVVAAIIYLKSKKLDVLDWGDMVVISVPLGYTFGRIGNFINGELYGRVTSGPWGMIFPTARPVPASADWVQQVASEANFSISEGSLLVNLPRHPSQLYEAFLEGILLWVVMWFFVRNRKPFRGFGIAIYLIGYGIARFIAEYTREPDPQLGYIWRLTGSDSPTQVFQSLADISMGQILSSLMVLSGLVVLVVFWGIHKRRPGFERVDLSPPKESKRGKKKR
ncbi:MAG: prolipoprotein diacylglyceryl transferase [Spirochaetales bacterium]|nr:prolipoprotein diacylglyceryl transferase [Spirochaetales bacterium]